MSAPAEWALDGELQDLPSPPAVVMELLSCIEQSDTDVALLAKKVATDQALTAKTLRLANSSLYSPSVKVATIQQAITFLGFQATRNLITAAALTGCFPSGQCAGFDDKAFWRHAIATATCARVLARHLRINQDIAFTAGLLHDIGRLVLVTLDPQRYAGVIAWRKAHDVPLLTAEREVLGVDHVMAGSALARQWGFSETMRQAISFHHAPDTPGAGFLATIVHAADAVAHGLDLAGDEEEMVPPLSTVAWTALGLMEAEWLQVFRETELQFEETSTILMA
jgi:putative nucleotidyltransferase with HDIG domain